MPSCKQRGTWKISQREIPTRSVIVRDPKTDYRLDLLLEMNAIEIARRLRRKRWRFTQARNVLDASISGSGNFRTPSPIGSRDPASYSKAEQRLLFIADRRLISSNKVRKGVQVSAVVLLARSWSPRFYWHL